MQHRSRQKRHMLRKKHCSKFKKILKFFVCSSQSFFHQHVRRNFCLSCTKGFHCISVEFQRGTSCINLIQIKLFSPPLYFLFPARCYLTERGTDAKRALTWWPLRGNWNLSQLLQWQECKCAHVGRGGRRRKVFWWGFFFFLNHYWLGIPIYWNARPGVTVLCAVSSAAGAFTPQTEVSKPPSTTNARSHSDAGGGWLHCILMWCLHLKKPHISCDCQQKYLSSRCAMLQVTQLTPSWPFPTFS